MYFSYCNTRSVDIKHHISIFFSIIIAPLIFAYMQTQTHTHTRLHKHALILVRLDQSHKMMSEGISEVYILLYRNDSK
jgi:uncharacterized membrane protein